MTSAESATLRHAKGRVRPQRWTCGRGDNAQHGCDGARASILGAQGVLINDAVEGQDQSRPGEVSGETDK